MKKFTLIENAQLVLETGILWDGTLLIEGNRIVDFGKKNEISIPSDVYRFDAKGMYVGPGFVDIHVHGGGGFSTCFEAEKAADYFLRHGTTSLLATPDYSMSLNTLLSAIRDLKEDIPKAKTVRGIYFEGPYTNPKYGANAHINPWNHPIDPKEYMQFVDAAGDLARVWTIAPELDGLIPFLAYARKINPNVLFAVGHSEALPAQIRALGTAYRPTILTHATNATAQPYIDDGIRAYGPDEYFYQMPDTYTELISDSLAVHVHPDMQRLLVQIKGIHRIVLVSDSTHFDFPTPPEYALATDLNFDDIGGLAGSKITLNQACRNVMTHTNCGIAQAFIMASLNPARAVGLDLERGSIERGKIADLVVVNDRFDVKDVILDGIPCNI